MELSTLKDVCTEMVTFTVLGFILSSILGIANLFGAGITLYYTALPFVFSLSCAVMILSCLGIWVGYHYFLYIIDRSHHEP